MTMINMFNKYLTKYLTRHITIIDRYIAAEFMLSYFVSFLFYFLIFFLNQLLLMAQNILSKGIPLGSVLLLMIYALPSFINLSAPFGTLTATMMAYGRFASDNEILAMRSAGIRRSSIFRPVLIIGILISIVSFGVNDIILPRGVKAFQELWLELILTHPGIELEEYSVRTFQNTILITGAIDSEGIHPMVIIEREESGDRILIVSRIAASNKSTKTDVQYSSFRMHDTFTLIPDSRNLETWTWATADYLDYRLLTGNLGMGNQQIGPSNMRVKDVWSTIKEKQTALNRKISTLKEDARRSEYNIYTFYKTIARNPSPMSPSILGRIQDLKAIKDNVSEREKPKDSSLQVWKLEFFQKFAIPFASIPFVFLAFPLGLLARKSGRAVGFFVGLMLTSLYWSVLVLGRLLGLRADISPFLVMVLPDMLLLAVGVLLYWRRGHV